MSSGTRGSRAVRLYARQTLGFVASTLALLLAANAHTQVGVGVEIPESGTMTVSHSTVLFDLASDGYPPASFPAYYLPTDPDPQSDHMSFSVFSNLGNWTVDVVFPGLYNELDNVILAPDRLEYSTDEGTTWHAFSLGANTLVQNLDGSASAVTVPFMIRLRLVGDEAPGSYSGVLTFSLVTQ